MKYIWQPSDLVDLEYFLFEDKKNLERGKGISLIQRDRTFFLSLEQQGVKKDNKKELIWLWLNNRKQECQNVATLRLPGSILNEIIKLVGVLMALGGLACGIGTALPFLSYTGKEPLNALLFFVVFVLLHFFIIVCQIGLATYRRAISNTSTGNFLSRYVRNILLKILHKRILSTKGNDNGYEWAENLVKLSPVIMWMVFILLQVAGVCFNIGVILAIVGKVTLFDTGFGWQSSLLVSEEFLAGILQAIATPWSWFVPEALAYPDLETLKGSRIVLKDGIGALSFEAMVSWWPFLCFSVAVYAALPRMLMCVFGKMKLNAVRKALPDVDQSELRQLLQRMMTPLVEAGGRKAENNKKERTTLSQTPSSNLDPSFIAQATKATGVLCIPDELYDDCPLDELFEHLQGRLPDISFLKNIVTYELGEEESIENKIMETIDDNLVESLVVFQEGWQPPIEEMFSFLRCIRNVIDEKITIFILLVGKPASGTILTEVTALDYEIWNNKLAVLQDQSLEILAFKNKNDLL